MLIGTTIVEFDWEVWALPLCIARGWGQTIVRIGPVCISWRQRSDDRTNAQPRQSESVKIK